MRRYSPDFPSRREGLPRFWPSPLFGSPNLNPRLCTALGRHHRRPLALPQIRHLSDALLRSVEMRDAEPSITQSFDCSRSATRRAISADASSGIGKTELTLISPST